MMTKGVVFSLVAVGVFIILFSSTAIATCAGNLNSRSMYVSSQYQSTMPYLVNQSTLYLNGSTAQVMWTIAGNNSYLCDSGSTNYTIKDSTDTTQQNMTNESASVTSYGNLWQGMNGLISRWGLNNNALDSREKITGHLWA